MRGNLRATKLTSDLVETVSVWAILLIPYISGTSGRDI